MNDDILIWESYLKFHKILIESTQTLESFKSNLLGAFRIIFDLDKEEINSKKIHKPSTIWGQMTGYKIDYEPHCPPKANNMILGYFPILYKTKTYLIELHITEWSFMPQLEDFHKSSYGTFSDIKRNPINTDSVFTCSGRVKEVIHDRRSIEKKVIGNIEPRYDGNFHQFLIRDGNMANLAVRVKKIIDGDDGDKNKKEVTPPSTPKKNTPTSPQLVGV